MVHDFLCLEAYTYNAQFKIYIGLKINLCKRKLLMIDIAFLNISGFGQTGSASNSALFLKHKCSKTASILTLLHPGSKLMRFILLVMLQDHAHITITTQQLQHSFKPQLPLPLGSYST